MTQSEKVEYWKGQIAIHSPNLCRDTTFRRQVLGSGQHGSSDEAWAIVSHAFDKKNDNLMFNEDLGTMRKVLSFGENSEKASSKPCCGERSNLEVKAKLFLNCTDDILVQESIDHLLKTIDSTYVDSLQLAVPESSLSFLGIASEPRPKNDDYEAHLKRFINLYEQLELCIDRGQLKSIGLCDVEGETLKRIFDVVKHKPKIITINLNACCAIPDDLRDFAKSKGVELKTHSDAEVMLEQRKLDVFDCSMEWMVRFQIMDTSRGVIQDKRYIIALRKIGN